MVFQSRWWHDVKVATGLVKILVHGCWGAVERNTSFLIKHQNLVKHA